MGMNLASGFGAAAGAQSLEDILKQKFVEQIQKAKLAEDQRQADMTNQVQQAQLGQGQQRIGLEGERVGLEGRRVNLGETQYAEGAPQRAASLAQTTAQTNDLMRRPAAEELSRNFTGGQNDLNRQNAVRIAGMHGKNALDVANVRHPDAPAQTPQQENEVHDSLGLIDQIANDPALNSAVGPVDAYVGKARDLTGVTRFDNLHQQLLGKLSLAQAGKLKGQGQISDKERAMLASAASALSRNLSEADYKAELAKIRGQFERMQASAPATPAAQPHGAPQEFDYVPGKGLVPRKP